MRIREATVHDATKIAEIHVRAWQAVYRGQLSDEYLDGLRVQDRLEMHRRSLEQPAHDWRTWVAEKDGAVVGFAVTGPSEDADADERTGEIYAIYLEPERIGRGIGRELFAHAVDDLRERGYTAATLWVLESNTTARRFYDRAGWSSDGATTSERVDCEMRPTVRYRTALV